MDSESETSGWLRREFTEKMLLDLQIQYTMPSLTKTGCVINAGEVINRLIIVISKARARNSGS